MQNEDHEFHWALKEVLIAFPYAAMTAWGLWMIGSMPWRAIIVAAIVWLFIMSGIAWRKLQQASLALFGFGLIVWSHVPIADHIVAIVRTWFNQS